MLAGMALWTVAASAQEELPQITPAERKAPRKKDAGPRAVALLQLTSSGKASLLPIAILINGKFWDASAYKAAPVPMALDSGTVYEAERTGSSLGLFTVNTALHSNAANAPSRWIGTGAWVPAGTEKTKTSLQAEAVPAGIDTTEGPPRLTKNPSKETPAASSPTAAPSSAPASKPSSDDEPPRLTKPANQAPPESSAPTSTPSSTPPQGDSKGAPGAPQSETTPGEAKPADKPKAPESDSGADVGSRPRLRRGKPAESFADEEVPGYSKPGAAPSTNAGKKPEAAPAGPVQLIPAISDAGGPDPHSFGFEFLKDEEGERLQQMTAMAKQQLHSYLEAQAKARIVPKTAAKMSGRLAAKKGPEPILSNVQMKAYDLWSSNQPVLVFSAQAQMPPAAEGSSPGPSGDLQYSILLVAYPDIYHDLHKIYAAVTDKYHLDITPRLELIDAVDADGDGRGELLFRETSDGGSGWAIYRASADKLWKMYDSLNPE